MAETVKIKIETTGGDNIAKNIDEGSEAAKNLKQQLREATIELQNLSQTPGVDPKAVEEAAIKVGELKDAIADANEQANVFASGSKYERVSNAFGEIKGAILNLDFEKASQRAQAFATAARGITFGGAIQSVKQLGSTFMTVGKALLTNPLFLIGGAIALLVVAIVKVLDKLGVLKQITEAVGKAFDLLMKGIEAVVTAITDFIGVTSEAERQASTSLDNTIDKLQKTRDKSKGISDNYIIALENQLKVAKAAGEDTAAIELELLRVRRDTTARSIELDREEIDAKREKLLTNKSLSDEEKENLRKEIETLRKGIGDKRTEYKRLEGDISAFKINGQRERAELDKKNAEDEAKKAEDAAKKAADKQREYDKARLDTRRQIQDLNASLITDDFTKEITLNNLKYERLIEDTKKNEKLLASEKQTLVNLFEEERKLNEEKIRENKKKKDEEDKNAEITRQKKLMDEMKALDDEAWNKEKEARDLRTQYILDEDLKKITERQNEYANELVELQNALDNEIITREEYDKLIVAAEKKKNKDIQDLNEETAEKARLAKQKELNDTLEFANQSFTALSNLSSAVFDIKKRGLEKGSAEEIKAAKKNFEVTKSLQMALAVTTGIMSVMAAYENGMKNPIPLLGPATAAIYAGVAAVTAIANVAKIAATKFEPGTPSSSSPSPDTGGSPTAPSAAPIPSSLTINGNPLSGGEGGNLQLFGSRQGGDMRAYVVESDVSGVQQRMRRYRDRAEIG